ncbi:MULTISPECIES: glycosyltransferase [Rhodomicrobium]|uniref:glycosyltransferase n=1 Tax=Rhodomicrobium TaxID=1068 RepID=UPI000F735B40|nr:MULTISPECIES: glycosyltransferase [Rhodomicrobium]
MQSLIRDHPARAETTGAAAMPGAEPGPLIAFFGHDSAESTVIKRARGFQASGARVMGFMFRREREGRDAAPEWDNVDLGTTVDRNYLERLPKLLLGVIRAVRRRALLRQCDAIYARNLDMLLVAVLAKALTGAKAPIAYEVLDVRRVFLGDGLASRLFRWAERRLMAGSSLLVVSAPDYIRHYFEPRQNYTGRWFLLENKLPAAAFPEGGALPQGGLPPGPPWVIGMFGVLKCARSMAILTHLAERLGDKVAITLRGIPSETDIPAETIRAAAARLPNLTFEGPYVNPRDLAEIYSKVHFIWTADFLDPGGNSEWCLANRLYEGGLMGAVMIAASGNATGDMVEREHLGFTLAEPLEEEAVRFLETLTEDEYTAARHSVRHADPALFIDTTDTARLVRAVCKP